MLGRIIKLFFWFFAISWLFKALFREQSPRGSSQQVPPNWNTQQHPRQPPPPSSSSSHHAPSAYTILNVAPGASWDEIKHAYQLLIQQYHPDKVADLGPELQALAEKRTKEINAAYSQLKAQQRKAS